MNHRNRNFYATPVATSNPTNLTAFTAYVRLTRGSAHLNRDIDIAGPPLCAPLPFDRLSAPPRGP